MKSAARGNQARKRVTGTAILTPSVSVRLQPVTPAPSRTRIKAGEGSICGIAVRREPAIVASVSPDDITGEKLS